MSDTPLGDGWWIASDGKWYDPRLHPDYVAPTAPPVEQPPAETPAVSVPPVIETPPVTEASVPPVTETPPVTEASVPPVTETPPVTEASVPPVTETPPVEVPATPAVQAPVTQGEAATQAPGPTFVAPSQETGAATVETTVMPTPAVDATAANEPTYGIPPAEPEASGSRRGLILALAGLVFLAVIGFLAFRLLGGSSGGGVGASSPDQAIQQLLDSVNEADAVGLIGIFDPEEVDAWSSSFTPALDSLYTSRGEESPNEQAIDSYETLLEALSVTITGPDGEDPVYEVQMLEDGERLARVSMDGIDMSFSSDEDIDDAVVVAANADVGALDLRAISEYRVEIRDNGRGIVAKVFDADGLVGEETADELDLEFVAIEREGKWYLSTGYTLMEWIRRGADLRAQPDFGAAFDAVDEQQGAATAEDAVRDLATAIEELDYAAAARLMDPVALPYLHDYLPLIEAEVSLSDQQDAADELDVHFDVLELGTTEWEGRTVVTISDVEGRIAGGDFRLNTDRWCGEAELDGDRIEGCAEDAIVEALDEIGDYETDPGSLLPERLGFVVSEHNGTWFVHPLATIGWYVDQIAQPLQDVIDNASEEAGGADQLVESFVVARSPIARQGSPATSAAVDGVAAVAASLEDFDSSASSRDEVNVALAQITVTESADLITNEWYLNGAFPTIDGPTWAVVSDNVSGSDPELPAVAVETEGELSIELFDAAPVTITRDGLTGKIDADGRPQVFFWDEQGPELDIFGAQSATLYSGDDHSVLVLHDQAESETYFYGGQTIVVWGEPGDEFEFFVN